MRIIRKGKRHFLPLLPANPGKRSAGAENKPWQVPAGEVRAGICFPCQSK